jgi:hypothetical protein
VRHTTPRGPVLLASIIESPVAQGQHLPRQMTKLSSGLLDGELIELLL